MSVHCSATLTYRSPRPSPAALLSFEWAITVDREARLVWGRKTTGATVLFVLNRYWLFLEYITEVISMYPLSDLVSRLWLPCNFSC